MNLPLWELLEHLDPQQRVDFPGPSSFMPTQQCCMERAWARKGYSCKDVQREDICAV